MRYFLPILAALMVVGCTKTIYVPKEVVKTEYRDRVQYDSIFERDSIFIREKGDTIYIYQDRWRDRYHILRDTVCRIDSVSYPVIVEVETIIKHIPKVYRWCFGFSMLILGGGAIWLIRKFRLF